MFSPDKLNIHSASVTVSPLEKSEGLDEVLQETVDDGFKFRSVTLADIVPTVSYFFSQARGEDAIPQSVLVKALPFIGDFLVKIFNCFLKQRLFPNGWKKPQLIAPNIVSASSSPSDFQSIALLSFLFKVLEKLSHVQITECLMENDFFDPLHADFRRFNST